MRADRDRARSSGPDQITCSTDGTGSSRLRPLVEAETLLSRTQPIRRNISMSRKLRAGLTAHASLAVLVLIFPPAPAHAQQNDNTFRGAGTIVAVQGRRVETPASWYLESADGKRTEILQCGRVDYTKYLRQEVEIEATWNSRAGICIDKLRTVAEAAEAKRAAEEAKQAADKPASLSTPEAIALKYAPVVWLAQGEQWLPSSIEFYADNVKAVCNGKTVTENILSLQPEMLPPNGGDSRCHFVTRQPLSDPYDRPAFLHGQNPAQTSVPIYVFLYSDPRLFRSDGPFLPGGDPNGGLSRGGGLLPRGGDEFARQDSFYAQYKTFYPYNYGKDICPSVAPNDNCVGIRVSMGNHVADWELMTIRFEHGHPVAVHVGAHGNEIPTTAWTFRAPAWTTSGNAFQVPDGLKSKSTKQLEEIFQDLANIQIGWIGAIRDLHQLEWEGDHPIIYSAKGSHGTYGWPDGHLYLKNPVGDEYVDSTSRGIKWETWKNVAWAHDPKYRTLLYGYNGRWGNAHMGKSGCDVSYVPGYTCGALKIPDNEYQLNEGPELPDRQRDWQYLNLK